MWRLIALGVLAFAAFIIVTLPATVITDRVQSADVQPQAVEGTIWNGDIGQLQIGGTPLGHLHWQLHPLALLTAKADADITLNGSNVNLLGNLRSSFDGNSIRFDHLKGALPLALLPRNALPGGWTGKVDFDFTTLELDKGWPIKAIGQVTTANLTGPAQHPQNIGDYRVTFVDAPAGTVNGNLQSVSGPLDVVGTLRISSNRSYVIDGEAGAHADAPPDVVDALRYLGAPQANGRYQFSVAGTM
jgi:general secretion pathway protein N